MQAEEGVHDPLGMLRAECVPGAARQIVVARVDEQHLARSLRAFVSRPPQDQHTGGDAGAREEVGAEADHGLDDVVAQQAFPDLAVTAGAEEYAVRHDRGRDAAFLKGSNHVLSEHQIGPAAPCPAPPHPLAVFRIRLDDQLRVVLQGHGRVGEHLGELPQPAVLVEVLWVGQGVAVLQVEFPDAVQQHVHGGDAPRGGVRVLAAEREPAGVTTVFADVLMGRDQHAAGARAGVVDGVTGVRVDEPDHHPHHVTRGVELSAAPTCGVGERVEEVPVRGSEHVRERNIFVP